MTNQIGLLFQNVLIELLQLEEQGQEKLMLYKI